MEQLVAEKAPDEDCKTLSKILQYIYDLGKEMERVKSLRCCLKWQHAVLKILPVALQSAAIRSYAND